MRTAWFAALAHVLVATHGWAQPTWITNARVEVVTAGADVARTVDARLALAGGSGWIGYAVPIISGDRFLCDWTEGNRRAAPATVKLEGADELYVLLRVEDRAVTRIRSFSEGCTLDAGGLPVTWVNGVSSDGSVMLLGRYLVPTAPRRVADGAMAALAVHDTATASTTLLTVARTGATAHLRGQALFWVAQRAGDRAVPVISEAIDRDPDTDVKKRAVFALSQLPAGEGVPRLIEVAASHSNPAVRRQAMFWLGQSRDPRALAFFERILLR